MSSSLDVPEPEDQAYAYSSHRHSIQSEDTTKDRQHVSSSTVPYEPESLSTSSFLSELPHVPSASSFTPINRQSKTAWGDVPAYAAPTVNHSSGVVANESDLEQTASPLREHILISSTAIEMPTAKRQKIVRESIPSGAGQKRRSSKAEGIADQPSPNCFLEIPRTKPASHRGVTKNAAANGESECTQADRSVLSALTISKLNGFRFDKSQPSLPSRLGTEDPQWDNVDEWHRDRNQPFAPASSHLKSDNPCAKLVKPSTHQAISSENPELNSKDELNMGGHLMRTVKGVEPPSWIEHCGITQDAVGLVCHNPIEERQAIDQASLYEDDFAAGHELAPFLRSADSVPYDSKSPQHTSDPHEEECDDKYGELQASGTSRTHRGSRQPLVNDTTEDDFFVDEQDFAEALGTLEMGQITQIGLSTDHHGRPSDYIDSRDLAASSNVGAKQVTDSLLQIPLSTVCSETLRMDILRAKPFEEWASQGANGRRLINGCLAPIQLKVSKNALDLAATVLPRYGDNDKPSSWSTDAQRSSYPHPLRTIPKAIPPFMRPTFPKGVPPRSHISGINESNRLLTCFRAVETLRACRNSLTPSLVELYGQVTVSHRSGNLQLFTFADLFFPSRAPYIEGAHTTWRGHGVFEADTHAFLPATAEEPVMCRAILKFAPVTSTVKQSSAGSSIRRAQVLNIWQTTWEDVSWVRGIVMS